MNQTLFIIVIAIFNIALICWGHLVLPKENRQFLAVIPQKKIKNKWKGLNLTYYGLLSANAYTFAVIMFFTLNTCVGTPLWALCLMVITLLAICIPSASLVARIVEKKSGTLTVGGAVFVGTLSVPFIVFFMNQLMGVDNDISISSRVFLSSLCVAYAFGEGLGRLACISFGCCYGKPLDHCPPHTQKIFSRFYLIFTGKTKKISYASDQEGKKTLPVQTITASLYCGCGLAGTWFFLNGQFFMATLVTILTTQLWRFFSEFLRSDFRGHSKITAYQIMSIVTVLYTLAVYTFALPVNTVPDLENTLDALWNPWMILFCQMIWVIVFTSTARSVVTGSEISFHINQDTI